MNEAPAGTSQGPHGYRDFLPFAGAVRTASAAATMTATAIFLSSDLFNTSASGITGSSVPAGPPKVEAEELR